MAMYNLQKEKEVELQNIRIRKQKLYLVSFRILIMNDKKIEVCVNKLDSETKEGLQGAQISLYTNRKLYNYDGEVIADPNTNWKQ